jgi:hypothetical protein
LLIFAAWLKALAHDLLRAMPPILAAAADCISTPDGDDRIVRP